VQSLRKTQLLLVAIIAAALAPFLNKAFHIDDPLFIWMAQQIAKHPFDPYGFYVNWVSFRQPMTIVMGLAFSGGCFVSALFFAPFRDRRLFLPAAISFGAFAAAFKVLTCSWIYLETAEAAVWLEGGFFATIGVGILALAVLNMLQQKSADALFLLLWIVGTFCFATFFNWSITARTFLPMAPAIAILTIQHFERLQKPSKARLSTSPGCRRIIDIDRSRRLSTG
jgi:hypothetical protein